MKQRQRWLLNGVGVFTLLFGLLCLNYTKMGSAEHHAQIAQQARLATTQPKHSLSRHGVRTARSGLGRIRYWQEAGRTFAGAE